MICSGDGRVLVVLDLGGCDGECNVVEETTDEEVSASS